MLVHRLGDLGLAKLDPEILQVTSVPDAVLNGFIFWIHRHDDEDLKRGVLEIVQGFRFRFPLGDGSPDFVADRGEAVLLAGDESGR